MAPDRKIRVLMSKVGLDGHDRGIKIISAYLKEAGMEVIYLGRFQTAENIVSAAVQEDVDVIGLSCLDGEHLPFTPKILGLLKKKNADIPLVIGGVIPKKDAVALKKMGVRGVFTPGSSLNEIMEHIRNIAGDGNSQVKISN